MKRIQTEFLEAIDGIYDEKWKVTVKDNDLEI